MYLSCLLIDVGGNPDRPRPGRLWLRNRYRVHQRLCMAFPSAACVQADPLFLQPYVPERFIHVHKRRSGDQAFLFRLDPQPGGRVVILVQSAIEPNWAYAFHNASYLLGAPVSTKPFDPRFTDGQRLHFRLAANPTKRLRNGSLDAKGRPIESKWVGKRVPVLSSQLGSWLERRAERSGFRLDAPIGIRSGFVHVGKGAAHGDRQRLSSVRYEGILEVTDRQRFREALVSGIGPAKAFGFGLLSVTPVR
ncbi:MAG: hypothetical protein AMXMBFR13_40970 [Phycisphaerae bacterium]